MLNKLLEICLMFFLKLIKLLSYFLFVKSWYNKFAKKKYKINYKLFKLFDSILRYQHTPFGLLF